jgi:hypothetical protein
MMTWWARKAASISSRLALTGKDSGKVMTGCNGSNRLSGKPAIIVRAQIQIVMQVATPKLNTRVISIRRLSFAIRHIRIRPDMGQYADFPDQ